MKILTVLSGKGGVGKSTLVASLAVLLSRKKRIVSVDCDVDAPNLGLALGMKDKDFESWESVATNYKAFLDPEKCTGCGKCLDVCNFSAIDWDKKKRKPVINKLLCEGCGSCKLICPEGAIRLKKVFNAKVGVGKTIYGFPIVSGQLKMGEAGSGNVVDAVKIEAEALARENKADFMLVDSAAGIGCPVIASVRGSDYIIIVTEPSPAALWDAKRAAAMVEYFRIPYGVVINKWDLNRGFSGKIEQFAHKSGVPVLGKLPYDKKFVEALVNLKPAVVYEKGFEPLFSGILGKIPARFLNRG